MDLNFGSEYREFTNEVKKFCKKYSGVNFSDSAKVPLSASFKSSGIQMKRSDWQKILIEQGYFARSIPKEYGGYGGEADIIKSRIIASEFAKEKIPPPMGGQGIDMLVPTLLELGTEEQKQKYIKPTLHGEIIWCQGYSEPNAGSDLASLQTKGKETRYQLVETLRRTEGLGRKGGRKGSNNLKTLMMWSKILSHRATFNHPDVRGQRAPNLNSNEFQHDKDQTKCW